jgi:DNA-directed RNA polymerase subunit H
MSEFNVLMHELVPEHHLIPEDEEKDILKKLKVTKDHLPKIRKSDPVITILEEIQGEIKEGRIIKIIRKSPTAGYATAYRIVTLS